MCAVFQKPKAFKLRALDGHQRFGVAGKSPEEVLRKGCRLLQVPGGCIVLSCRSGSLQGFASRAEALGSAGTSDVAGRLLPGTGVPRPLLAVGLRNWLVPGAGPTELPVRM